MEGHHGRDHHGRYYTVENARLWTLPAVPSAVVMSALGEKAVQVATRVAEGYYGAWPAKGLLEQPAGARRSSARR